MFGAHIVAILANELGARVAAVELAIEKGIISREQFVELLTEVKTSGRKDLSISTDPISQECKLFWKGVAVN